jgi:hypothetical protein
MAARNPNVTRISDAVWRLWTDFDALEPTVLLGGVYAAKSGYHNYRGALDDDDYSVGHLLADRRGSAIKASAIDLTMSAAAMVRYTRRLDVAARARDPRLYTARGPVLREFIGTKDNRTVYCYVLVGGRPLGVGADAGADPGRDDSHLWHIHLSIIRQFCEDWAALDGVLSVLRGESLAAWRARTAEEDDMLLEERKMLEAINERTRALVHLLPSIKTTWAANPAGVEQIPAVTTLLAIAGGVDIDPAELALIKEAARAGAAAAADDIVTRVLAGLPEGTLTRDDVEAALREVLLTGVAEPS